MADLDQYLSPQEVQERNQWFDFDYEYEVYQRELEKEKSNP